MPQFPLPTGTGQVVTYQLAAVKPYGMQYKITPETTEKEVNTRTCFQLPGSKEDVVKAQSVFPDIKGFKVRNARVWIQPAARSIFRIWVGTPDSWRCSSPSKGCRVLGQARTCPRTPGRREGHLPARIGAGLPAPFPTPAAVLGRVTAHTNTGVSGWIGQVTAGCSAPASPSLQQDWVTGGVSGGDSELSPSWTLSQTLGKELGSTQD